MNSLEEPEILIFSKLENKIVFNFSGNNAIRYNLNQYDYSLY